jgi:hypothetical protein
LRGAARRIRTGDLLITEQRDRVEPWTRNCPAGSEQLDSIAPIDLQRECRLASSDVLRKESQELRRW